MAKDSFEDFDVIAFLESRSVEYQTSGKNVTEGWVEIQCPFCGQDPSQHFGINLNSGLGHCWICGIKSSPVKLIQEIDECTWDEAEATVNEFVINILDSGKPEKIESANTNIVWPEHMQDDIPTLHRKYIEGRGMDLDKLVREFGLKFVHNMGDWKFRIIIPVQFGGRIVTFTSRDVTGKAGIKYRHLPDSKAITPVKRILYNYDRIRDTAVLVEGPADVWRIGHGAVGSFGTQLTREQMALLTRVKNLFIMFDSDATDKALKLGELLESDFRHVEVIEMEDGDPAELSDDEIKHLRKELKL